MFSPFIYIFILSLKKSIYFLQWLYLSEPGQEHIWFVFNLEISRNKYKNKSRDRSEESLTGGPTFPCSPGSPPGPGDPCANKYHI